MLLHVQQVTGELIRELPGLTLHHGHIGDAHRHKLQPLIEGLGLPVMKDEDFIKSQKQLDGDARAQIMPADRKTQAATKEHAKGFKANPKPKKIGNVFHLPIDNIPNCEWKNESVDPTDTPGEYKVTARHVKLKLVWTKSGVSETLKELNYTCIRS